MTSYTTAVALCYAVLDPSSGLRTADIYLFLEEHADKLELSRRRSFKNGVRHCLSSQSAFSQPESLRLWLLNVEKLPRPARALYSCAKRIRREDSEISNDELVRQVLRTNLSGPAMDRELQEAHALAVNDQLPSETSPPSRSMTIPTSTARPMDMMRMMAYQQQAMMAQAVVWWQSQLHGQTMMQGAQGMVPTQTQTILPPPGPGILSTTSINASMPATSLHAFNGMFLAMRNMQAQNIPGNTNSCSPVPARAGSSSSSPEPQHT
eukprot:m.40644 g.40644  ORF g.40644 m.40644 type:complete len:265 (-) comp12765_c0_seq2:166-960(-)